MFCQACRETALKEKELPACIDPPTLEIVPGRCATGYDRLSGTDHRILEIRGLLINLHELHLADRICDEYGVTLADLQILAHLEDVLKEALKEHDDGDSSDHNPGKK